MAHECPECGRGCHCNGDIDDCFFEQSEEALSCHHCPDICGPECECEFKEYNDSDAHELSEND